MILYILGFFYIAASFLSRKHYNAYLGLLLVLLVMGFQSGVPGDYDSYQENFNYLMFENADASRLRNESGWILLIQFFGNIGSFHFFIFCISLLQYLILARFINLYADKRFRFIAGLIFYFSINMMLFQMKGLRQGLAVDLCVASLICLEKRKIISSGLIVLVACTFHTSTFLFVPFLLLYALIRDRKLMNELHDKFSVIFPVFATLAYLLLYFSKEVFLDYVEPILLSLNLGGYEGYFGQIEFVTYHPLITIYGCIVTFATSWYLTQTKGVVKYFTLLTLSSLFVELIFFCLGDLYRFSLFYGIFSIVVYPNIASLLHRRGYKLLSWAFAMLCVAYAWRTFITWTIRHSEDGFDNYRFLFL